MDETETEASEHDMYVAQLKEVFDSCDQTGSGKLNRQELFSLCDRLQLEDQSAFLVNGLLKDKDEVRMEGQKSIRCLHALQFSQLAKYLVTNQQLYM